MEIKLKLTSGAVADIKNKNDESVVELGDGDYISITPLFSGVSALQPFITATVHAMDGTQIDAFELCSSGATGKTHKRAVPEAKKPVIPAFEKKKTPPSLPAPSVQAPQRVVPVSPPRPLGGDDGDN